MREEAPGSEPAKRRGWSLWWPRLRPLVFLLVGLFALRVVVGLVGSVDWAQVADSFGRLSLWMAVPLVVDLLLRQSLNAVPLALYVPSLRLHRSLQNDLTANLAGTVAPPPADMVLRVAMFRSWGIDPVTGMSGVTLNMLTFYSVRFLAPVAGLALVAIHGAETSHWVTAGLSALVAVALLVLLGALVASDRLAARIGWWAGRLVRRVKPAIDPVTWAAALVDIRARSADQLRRGLGRSMLALLAMVACDATLLFLALRFAGVDATALPAIDIYSAFLLAYPLTLMPLFGLGLLDAALLGTWVVIAGTAYEPEIVAGLVIWRTLTILGPLAMGAITFGVWRSRYGEAVSLRGAGRREAPDGITGPGSGG